MLLDGKLDGYAEVPGWEQRAIYVDCELSPKQFLETLIHECMHAEDPDVVEKVIARRAKSIANILWRVGYRKKG